MRNHSNHRHDMVAAEMGKNMASIADLKYKDDRYRNIVWDVRTAMEEPANRARLNAYHDKLKHA